MALIKCPDCGKEISDQAIACPSCARPVGGVRTIEATGKKWKGLQIFSAIAFIFGVFLIFADPGFSYGPFIALGGLLLYLYASFTAWWHHG